jgi:hypothetical protein
MFKCICISLGCLLYAFNNSKITVQSTWNFVLGSLWEIVELFQFVKFIKTTLRHVHFCLHIQHADAIQYPMQNTRLHLHWFERWFVLFFQYNAILKYYEALLAMVVNSMICTFSAYSNNTAIKHDQLWVARMWIKLCKSIYYVKMWIATAGARSLC